MSSKKRSRTIFIIQTIRASIHRRSSRPSATAKRVAIVAPDKVGFGVTAQVSVQAGDHARETVEAFIGAVRAMPEVLEFQRVVGDIDFCMRVVTVDIPHYEDFYRRLTSVMPLRRVSSYFELQRLKSETALPLALANWRRTVDGDAGG